MCRLRMYFVVNNNQILDNWYLIYVEIDRFNESVELKKVITSTNVECLYLDINILMSFKK